MSWNRQPAPVCSSAADTFSGAVEHVKARDVTFQCVSRARSARRFSAEGPETARMGQRP